MDWLSDRSKSNDRGVCNDSETTSNIPKNSSINTCETLSSSYEPSRKKLDTQPSSSSSHETAIPDGRYQFCIMCAKTRMANSEEVLDGGSFLTTKNNEKEEEKTPPCQAERHIWVDISMRRSSNNNYCQNCLRNPHTRLLPGDSSRCPHTQNNLSSTPDCTFVSGLLTGLRSIQRRASTVLFCPCADGGDALGGVSYSSRMSG